MESIDLLPFNHFTFAGLFRLFGGKKEKYSLSNVYLQRANRSFPNVNNQFEQINYKQSRSAVGRSASASRRAGQPDKDNDTSKTVWNVWARAIFSNFVYIWIYHLRHSDIHSISVELLFIYFCQSNGSFFPEIDNVFVSRIHCKLLFSFFLFHPALLSRWCMHLFDLVYFPLSDYVMFFICGFIQIVHICCWRTGPPSKWKTWKDGRRWPRLSAMEIARRVCFFFISLLFGFLIIIIFYHPLLGCFWGCCIDTESVLYVYS